MPAEGLLALDQVIDGHEMTLTTKQLNGACVSHDVNKITNGRDAGYQIKHSKIRLEVEIFDPTEIVRMFQEG